MICFRDRTYCASPNCVNLCGRQLTPEVREAAESAGMMVAVGYFCGEPERVKEVTAS